MRWKISHHGHDPRQIDLLAVIALIIVIIAAWRYFEGGSEPPADRPPRSNKPRPPGLVGPQRGGGLFWFGWGR